MEDSASTSKRPAAERKLRMEVSLQRVQTSFEQAVSIVVEELKTLQANHTELQFQHTTLQEEHMKLHDEFEAQKVLWRDFKIWWREKRGKEKVNHTQQTPSRVGGPSSPLIPHLQTPDTSSAMNKHKKSKLSKVEISMLCNLGLEEIVATPKMERPGSTIKVKREVIDKDDHSTKQYTSSIEHISRSDGPSCSEQRPEQSKKRSRSSAAAEDYSSPSRQALKDIGNRSVNDSPSEEQDTLAQDSSHLTVGETDSSTKKRGRGRYSTGRLEETSRTINEEYEVDADRNGNVSFLHKSVVRDKAERKQMHAHDCECCSAYYKAVGEAPLRRFQDPRNISDLIDAVDGDQDEEADDLAERKRQIHRQQISRHRGYGPPASTPPGYWNISFPSTQKSEEINRLAREEHAKKWDQMARDPRFKKRV